MELSRRDVILSAVAVFIAWGYVTHWLPSLRFLPWAFVAGVLVSFLAVLWAILFHSRKVEHLDVHELYGPNHSAFIIPAVWPVEVAEFKKRSAYQPKPIYPPSLPLSHSVDRLLELVLRDFVVSWYSHISKRPAFKNEVDKVLRQALENIVDRLVGLDIIGLLVSRIVPVFTTHMKDFYEAESAVRGKKLTRNITESEELDLAIAGKFRNGNLHKAASLAFADAQNVQQQYLRSVILRLLPRVLPQSALTSQAVTILIKEIVACAVLAPALRLLADPDTWHQLLENYGRTLLQERKHVRKLRAALEEHAPQTPRSIKTTPFPKLEPNDSERKFEKFIRAIRQCHTLSDARRFRSEVAIQLRKESSLEGQDPLYLRRLETGKRLLDQKIAQLGAAGSTASKKNITTSGNGAPSMQIPHHETTTLREMLYNAAGLSYFMEFMDRQNLMRLVQFWIVVDGFRNPLEDDNEEYHTLGESSQTWTSSDRNDLAQINDAYLSKPEVKISPMSKEVVKEFLRAGKSATDMQYHAARRAVLRAQTAAYEEMRDPHFQNFKRSDLWFKFLQAEHAIEPATATIIQDYSHEDSDSPAHRPRAPPRAVTAITRSSDLRRAVASSGDIKASIKPADESSVRRSFDSGSSTSRPPLFDDDLDTDPMARSTTSFDSDRDIPRTTMEDPKVVDAMQAALNDIMDEKVEANGKLFSDAGLKSPLDDDSMRGSMELPRPGSAPPMKNREKPSIASLGLIEGLGRRGVFEDDLFGDEAPKFPEDDKEDDSDKREENEIHEAAPGDLGLTEAIDTLTLDIEKLVTQESIVDSLTKKAELTNNAAELRILRKSKTSLQRAISRKELQRQQYIIQESDNSLYGRANISIKSIMIGTDGDGKEFATYIVEVTRQAGEQMPAAAWVIARRFSEFHELNKRLRARYPQIKSLEFPRRQVPMLKLQKDFLEKRRVVLERYLRALLQIPAICRSRELRAFLSQQALPSTGPTSSQVDSRDFVSRIYNSVTDGMEEFLGNIPVLDQLSLAGQNLISAATTQLNATSNSGLPANTLHSEEMTASAEAEAEIAAFEARELEPFVKPICDLFLEGFELNRESNWLRGRAVVLVLQQLLGGTVERKVRENARTILSNDGMTKTIDSITEMLWPGGGARIQTKVRTPAEKIKSRKEAGVVLASLIPELVGSVVGRGNAHGAARRLLAMLNNERLNTHLVFTLFDEIIAIVFGDGVLR